VVEETGILRKNRHKSLAKFTT